MEIGVVGLALTLVAALALVGWLAGELHPDDQRRLRPWLLVAGSAIAVIAALVIVRTIQLGL